MKVMKIIKKIESLKETPILHCDNKDVYAYNSGINDAVLLIRAIEKGKEKEWFEGLTRSYTGPR